MDFGDVALQKMVLHEEKRGNGAKKEYTLVKSSGGHCFSAPASALLMKVLSLHRHLKSLDWQPVEPMADRAGVCCAEAKC